MGRPRRGTPGAVPDLSAATIAILLRGWSAEPPAPAAHGFGGGLLELFDGDRAIASLWRQHEPYLREIAARWGWAPSTIGPDGVPRFFAEHLAAGFRA